MKSKFWLLIFVVFSLLNSITVFSQNLVLNGSMEYWHETGIRAQAWGAWTRPDRFNIFRVSKDSKLKKDGKYSMRIDTKGPVNIYTGYSVVAGKKYTLSVWVRAEKTAKLLVKYSLARKPEVKKKVKETPEGFSKTFDLKPKEWQRVSVTATMPEGVTGATLYFCFPNMANVYNFYCAMLNEGDLGEYFPGKNYTDITPLNRIRKEGEVKFTPKSYNKDGKDLDDIEVKWIFDKDPMSYARLTLPDAFLPKRVGCEFEKPIMVRGIYYQVLDKEKTKDMSVTASVLKDGKWETIEHRDIYVGPTHLLNFTPVEVEGIRINFLPKEGKKVKSPKFSFIGVGQ